ncbi:c-type cytochrome [Ferrovum sp.]|uniref:c-type cytochrome n=1 Tax=Ferrovum sp. TaxID=2609467 RepID=UPI0026386E9F|nr:c-type cytochrome [Ferrovum sp.]
MRKSFTKITSGLAVAAALVSMTALAEEEGVMNGDPANGKKIFTEGKGAAPACMTCHGATGWGTEAMGAPRLNNLGFPYIVKQLTDLAEGRRTPSGAGAVMPLFAQQLTPQDRRDVSAYVNSLPLDPKELSDMQAIKDGGQPIGTRYKGEILVKYGVSGKVSACMSCHGYNGRGAAPVFPVIGEQKFTYLVNQLHNWRDESRANDPYGMMRAIAKKLSDEDILDAATYLATAPRTTEGNTRVPNTTR